MRNSPVVAIIDEFTAFGQFELDAHIALLATQGYKRVILVGDRFQATSGGYSPDSMSIKRVLNMHTSLGMPRDAHYQFVNKNGLDPAYFTTTGTKHTSIFAVPSTPFPEHSFDLCMRYYKEKRPDGTCESDQDFITVGQAQGSRAKNAVLCVPGPVIANGWLFDKREI